MPTTRPLDTLPRTAFNWTEVDVAKHFAQGRFADTVRAIRYIEIVRAWYPEQACLGRWTSQKCPGTVAWRYYSHAASAYLQVCDACAARAVRHSVAARAH